MRLLRVAAGVSLALGLLIALPWEPDVTFGFPARSTEQQEWKGRGGITRQTVHFPSHVDTPKQQQEQLEGWLYLPQERESDGNNKRRPPVLLMAAGLGAQRDHRLPDFAEEFAAAGYAVLLFDYRNWGGSTGEPRQLVSGPNHVQDYMSAALYVRNTTHGLGQTIDPERVILWGSSYSGGHSLRAAALLAAHNQPPIKVAAVVAMEPFTSALLLVRATVYHTLCPYGRSSRPDLSAVLASSATSNADPRAAVPLQQQAAVVPGMFTEAALWVGRGLKLVRVASVAVSDSLRAMLGLPTVYLPLILPASRAALPRAVPANLTGLRRWAALAVAPFMPYLSASVMTDNDYNKFMQAQPPNMLGGWQNLLSGRSMLTYLLYHPLSSAHLVPCPVLLVAGKQDTLTPPWSIRKAAARLSKTVNTTYVELDGPSSHITLYNNPRLISTMLDWLKVHVPLDVRDASPA